MRNEFQKGITFLEAQLEATNHRRAALMAALDGLRMVAASFEKVTPFRSKLNGTHAIVLAVVKDGSDTITAIAKAAKVKPATARAAVVSLERAGKVHREGRSRSTRYVATEKARAVQA